jgi:hypothetical protein
VRAAAAGRHLVLEKPVATTVDEARTVVDAVRAAGVHSSVVLTLRHAPDVRDWLAGMPSTPPAADTVGSARPEADAEIIAMASEGLAAAGVPQGAAILKINSRKLLNGLMASAGVIDEGQRLAVLRAVDKLDRLGADGVRLLLGEGRRDESGAFTKGAGLDAAAAERVLAFTRAGAGRGDTLSRLSNVIGGSAGVNSSNVRVAGVSAPSVPGTGGAPAMVVATVASPCQRPAGRSVIRGVSRMGLVSPGESVGIAPSFEAKGQQERTKAGGIILLFFVLCACQHV